MTVLARPPFVVFAAGWSICNFVQQIIILANEENPSPFVLSLYITWFFYVLVQTIQSWGAGLEGRVYPYLTYFVSFSTLAYSYCLCSILYMSILRYKAVFQESANWLNKVTIPLLTVIFIIRAARTVLIFIQNSGNTAFPQSNILQLITLFPILCITAGFDLLSLIKIWTLRGRGGGPKSSIVLNTENEGGNKSGFKNADLADDISQAPAQATAKINSAQQRAFRELFTGLAFELSLVIVSIVIAVLEAISYAQDKPSVMDWILINWCLYSYVVQKKSLTTIFRPGVIVDHLTKEKKKSSAGL